MTHSPARPFALTRPAHVDGAHLVVQDLDVVSSFYQRIIGLSVLEESGSGQVLGAHGIPLLSLTTGNNVRRAPRQAAGLFHTAFLVPDRKALAAWLFHAAESGVQLDGASDHLVSEALYLSDPEGNGIEIYRDRTPMEWNYHADGTVEMATERLNLQALYNSAPQERFNGMEPGTVIGHIHLQVGDIPQADAFYRDVLGLKIMARYPGASFFATGGYHHHIAANIWNSRGAMAREDAMSGLSDYTIRFNDQAALDQAVQNLDTLEIAATRTGTGWTLQDPWGIGLTLAA
ncbi:VOC family protein [Rhizobium helianthi]|uniref:VOC family protein n=1 Tax=Rhizobium helianthi TaxID=1132695 RepID=A0ABW4M5X7_9HYPH